MAVYAVRADGVSLRSAGSPREMFASYAKIMNMTARRKNAEQFKIANNTWVLSGEAVWPHREADGPIKTYALKLHWTALYYVCSDAIASSSFAHDRSVTTKSRMRLHFTDPLGMYPMQGNVVCSAVGAVAAMPYVSNGGLHAGGIPRHLHGLTVMAEDGRLCIGGKQFRLVQRVQPGELGAQLRAIAAPLFQEVEVWRALMGGSRYVHEALTAARISNIKEGLTLLARGDLQGALPVLCRGLPRKRVLSTSYALELFLLDQAAGIVEQFIGYIERGWGGGPIGLCVLVGEDGVEHSLPLGGAPKRDDFLGELRELLDEAGDRGVYHPPAERSAGPTLAGAHGE